MAANIKFTPLSGALSEAPLCYLLEINDFTILLDCGWSDSFDEGLLQEVVRVIDRVDAVLLSHPDLSHLGALPYLVGRHNLKAPIYSTLPVRRMGEMFMFDCYLAKQASSDFDVYDLNDLDQAFALHPWTELRYLQQFPLAGKGAGIIITPYNAGHYVGGSIWRINVNNEDIVYAVDYNHKKEKLLNETSFHDIFSRPALVISDAHNVLVPQMDKRQRDEEFLDAVMATLRGDGSVLIPVDAAGRVLELSLMLEAHWAANKVHFGLVFLSEMSHRVRDFAKTQLEWMSDQIGKGADVRGRGAANPFHFTFLKTCGSLEEMMPLGKGPKVVLATMPNLEAGFARQLLVEWAADRRNTILFVERAEANTLADTLQRHVPGPDPLRLDLTLARRVPLEGAELSTWQQQQAEGAVAMEDVKSPQDDEENEKPSSPAQVQLQHAGPQEAPLRACSGSISKLVRDALTGLVIQQLPEGLTMMSEPAAVLIDGFMVPQGAAFPMFPDEDEVFQEEWDEYGACIRPDQFPNLGLGPAGPSRPALPEVAEEVAPEIPTKLVSWKAQLIMQAAIRFYDYEGRADGRAMHQYLAKVAPRRLILVHGSPTATAELAGQLETELADFQTQVYTPGVGETVDVSLSASHQLYLSEAVLRQAHMHAAGQYAVAWLEGTVAPPDPHHPSYLQLQPSAAMAESADAAATASSSGGGSVFITPADQAIKLTTLKKALDLAGFPSSFQGRGVLAVGSTSANADQQQRARKQQEQLLTVMLDASEKAHVVLQGALSADYYRVRQVIYSQFGIC